MANFCSNSNIDCMTEEELDIERKYQILISNISDDTMFKVKVRTERTIDDYKSFIVSDVMLHAEKVLELYRYQLSFITPRSTYKLGDTHRPFLNEEEEQNHWDLENVRAAVYHLNMIAEGKTPEEDENRL